MGRKVIPAARLHQPRKMSAASVLEKSKDKKLTVHCIEAIDARWSKDEWPAGEKDVPSKSQVVNSWSASKVQHAKLRSLLASDLLTLGQRKTRDKSWRT